MDLEQQQRIIERVLAHVEAGTSDMTPAERRVPVEHYTSAEQAANEQARLFRRLPLILAHGSEVPNPGDYLTVNRYDVPVLLTRDQEGGVRAFLNACTHRGARLVREGQGCGKKAFSCPYHGWTFGNDGRLLHITHEECFPTTDKDAYGLVALPAEERFGFVWVVLDPAGTLDLDAFLGEAAADLAWLELDTHVPFRPFERRCQANWKIVMEGFLEQYHIPYAHTEMVYKYYIDTLVADQLGWHQRLVTPRVSAAKLAGADRKRWRLRPCATIAYNILPNAILIAHPDHVAWVRFYPDGPDACDAHWVMLIPQATGGEGWADYWETVRHEHRRTFEEDAVIGEGIHAGMTGGSVLSTVVGRNERGVAGSMDGLAALLADGFTES